MRYPNITMKINPPVYQRVTAIKQAMEAELQRQVSYSEALDKMADHYEATSRLLRDVEEAGR